MPKGPIRRAQLISPFGVGSMVVVRDGTSVMTAGLDHWYEREDGETDSRDIDIEEYKFDEWRLQRLLRVSHFRLPPDYRSRRRAGDFRNSRDSADWLCATGLSRGGRTSGGGPTCGGPLGPTVACLPVPNGRG